MNLVLGQILLDGPKCVGQREKTQKKNIRKRKIYNMLLNLLYVTNWWCIKIYRPIPTLNRNQQTQRQNILLNS